MPHDIVNGHVGHNHPGRAAVQRVSNLDRRIVAESNEAGHVRRAQRADAAIEFQPAEGCMLGVDRNRVQ